VETPPDEIGWVHHEIREVYVRLENERREAAEAKVPPRWIQVPT